MMSFDSITDGSNSKSYFRRAHGEFTNIRYISPGSSITLTPDPKIVEIRSFLRNAVEQPGMPSTLRDSYTNVTGYTLGAFIHILLVIAVIMILLNFISGKRRL